MRFEKDPLEVPVTDPNGAVTGAGRPKTPFGAKLVDASLSGSGSLRVLVFDNRVVGATASSTKASGPIVLTRPRR